MRLLEVNVYGEDKEYLTLTFETKHDNILKFHRVGNGEFTVESDNATIDEVLEAIEIVKSGKLVIEL